MTSARERREESKTGREDGPRRRQAHSRAKASPPLFYGHAPALSLRSGTRVQAKLSVSRPGDPFEQEADRVAERVMRAPDSSSDKRGGCSCGGSCAECGGERPALQRRVAASDHAGEAPESVRGVLSSAGRPLDSATRSFMEPRLGRDLGGVRVHTDAAAADSARDVQALAYTVGQDMVFARGLYAPHTHEGRKLLAHELAHVAQQTEGGAPLVQRQPTFPPGGQSPPSPDFSGLIRLREDGRLEFIAGGPSLPVVGNLGAGFRCQNGRCQFIMGQDPWDVNNATYSVDDALGLLRGAGGGSGTTPRGGPLLPTIPGIGPTRTPPPPEPGCLMPNIFTGRCDIRMPDVGQLGGTQPTPSTGYTLPPGGLLGGTAYRLSLEHSAIIDRFNVSVSATPNTTEARASLDSLASALNATEGDVYIEGHTDSTDTEERNQGLSERRAQSVRDALVARGVRADRLHTEGFGERRLRFPEESTDDERARNRRVEVRYRVFLPPLPPPPLFRVTPPISLTPPRPATP